MGIFLRPAFMSLQTYGKVQGFLFSFQMLCFLWQRIFFFSVLTLKPSPIILPWRPSKDPDQRAKQDNKAKKTWGREVWFGSWFIKAQWFFFQRYFSFCLLFRSGRAAPVRSVAGTNSSLGVLNTHCSGLLNECLSALVHETLGKA